MTEHWLATALLYAATVGHLAAAGPEALATAPASPGAAVQETDTLTRVHDFAGITVIHRFLPQSRVVAVNLYLLGGARQLTDTTAGIEPLLLRVSEHGTENYPGPAAREALARTGSWTFIESETDWTVFGMRGLAETFDSTWAVFADRIMRPTLDTAAVQTERAKMVAAARARMSDPDERVRRMAKESALGSHPYRFDVRGTKSSLAHLDVSDLESYLANQVVKSRMLLVVAGNISAERVESALAETLGQLPAGDYAWELPPAWTASEPSVTVEYRAIPTKYVLGYFGGPSADSDDHAAFRVAVVALSSVIGSGIMEKGLTYTGGAFVFDQGASAGGIYFSTDLPKECVNVANTAMELLKRVTFQRSDLREYARSSIVDYYLQSETSGEQADVLGRTYLYHGVLSSPEEHVEALAHVSPSEVRAAARKYFKNVQYAFLGDTTNVPRKEMTKR